LKKVGSRAHFFLAKGRYSFEIREAIARSTPGH
jgi:hypothetical protein